MRSAVRNSGSWEAGPHRVCVVAFPPPFYIPAATADRDGRAPTTSTTRGHVGPGRPPAPTSYCLLQSDVAGRKSPRASPLGCLACLDTRQNPTLEENFSPHEGLN